MDLINQNLNKEVGSFYEILTEEGLFENKLFFDLVSEIITINNTKLNEINRIKKSNKIWELGFTIQSSISHHFHKLDVYEITNLNEEKIVELNNIIRYICYAFKYNNDIDIDFINEQFRLAD